MRLTLSALVALSAVAFAGAAVAGPAEDIIAKEKCSKCHTASTTKKGPSWASVAEKHRGKPEDDDKLVTFIKTGGKTTDGDDHKKVDASDADLKAIIGIVLSTK